MVPSASSTSQTVYVNSYASSDYNWAINICFLMGKKAKEVKARHHFFEPEVN